MRIVFIGSVTFSASALEKLISIKANVVGVVTKKESNFNSDFCDLSKIAHSNQIPYNYTSNINSQDTLNWIREQQPDILFCFGWSNLIKKELLELTKSGVIGFHPALLPHNKGRHPLIWAKALGLKKTGCTFFFMDEGADSGDILSQKEFGINFDDDAQILYNKMTDTALIQIEEFHEKLKNDNFPRIVQDRNVGNNWRKRGVLDGQIDFRMNTENICNLVRALTFPYVGAHINFQNNFINVWKVSPIFNEVLLDNIEPGKILCINENYFDVKTGDGLIRITKHDFKELPLVGTYL